MYACPDHTRNSTSLDVYILSRGACRVFDPTSQVFSPSECCSPCCQHLSASLASLSRAYRVSLTLLPFRHNVAHGHQHIALQYDRMHSVRRHDEELELAMRTQNLHSRHMIMSRQRVLVLIRLLPLSSSELLRANGDGCRALLAKVVSVGLEAVVRRQEHLLPKHSASHPKRIGLNVFKAA
jgi:hypothetical protein